MQADVLIAVGSNLGSAGENLDRAVEYLEQLPGLEITAVSSWHITQPIGGPAGQPTFANGALRAQTTLTPHELLRQLQHVEQQLHRERKEFWGPRTLDLDLLLYGDQALDDPLLVLPHPRMAVRPFVLHPAAEIASDMLHPPSGRTIGALASHLAASPKLLAILGGLPSFRSQLAEEIARVSGARLTRQADATSSEAQWEAVTCDWLPAATGPALSRDLPRSLLLVASESSDQPIDVWRRARQLPPMIVARSLDLALLVREGVAMIDCMR